MIIIIIIIIMRIISDFMIESRNLEKKAIKTKMVLVHGQQCPFRLASFLQDTFTIFTRRKLAKKEIIGHAPTDGSKKQGKLRKALKKQYRRKPMG